MEYSEALEDKAKAQAECIIELEDRVDGKTFLTNTTDYASNAVSMRASKELTEIQSMVKQLSASVNTQAAKVSTLFTGITELIN